MAAAKLPRRPPRRSAKPSKQSRVICPCILVGSVTPGIGAILFACGCLAGAGRRSAEFDIALQRADDQVVPAVRLRDSINLATSNGCKANVPVWGLIKRAADSLRSVAVGLSPSSRYWAHVEDNLGNAFAALGSTTEDIVAFDAALDGRQTASDRGDSLNNLGMAHAERDVTTGRARAIARRCHRCPGTSPRFSGGRSRTTCHGPVAGRPSSKQPECEVGKLRASVAASGPRCRYASVADAIRLGIHRSEHGSCPAQPGYPSRRLNPSVSAPAWAWPCA